MPTRQILDLGADDIPDYHRRLAELRQAAPVHPVLLHGVASFLVTTHEAVSAAFLDEARFGAVGGPSRDDPIYGHILTSHDFEEHRRYRRLTSRALRSEPILTRLARDATRVADELLGELAVRPELDVLEDFADPLAFRVMTDLLGVPRERRLEAAAAGRQLLDAGLNTNDAVSAAGRLGDLFDTMIDEAVAGHAEDGLLVQLVSARSEGAALGHGDVVSFAKLLYANGADTTAHLTSNLVAVGLDQGRDRFDASPDAMLNETLRWEPPVAMIVREARVDTTFFGTRIPARSMVLFGIASANRDPLVFPEPDRFRADRSPGPVLSFGRGPHLCPGIPHARTIARVAASRLLANLQPRDAAMAGPAVGFIAGGLVRGARRLRVRLAG